MRKVSKNPYRSVKQNIRKQVSWVKEESNRSKPRSWKNRSFFSVHVCPLMKLPDFKVNAGSELPAL